MIRDHLQEIIRETYQEAGFERITTPIIEDAVNLDKKRRWRKFKSDLQDLKTRQKVILCLRSRSPYRTDACRYGAAL